MFIAEILSVRKVSGLFFVKYKVLILELDKSRAHSMKLNLLQS